MYGSHGPQSMFLVTSLYNFLSCILMLYVHSLVVPSPGQADMPWNHSDRIVAVVVRSGQYHGVCGAYSCTVLSDCVVCSVTSILFLSLRRREPRSTHAMHVPRPTPSKDRFSRSIIRQRQRFAQSEIGICVHQEDSRYDLSLSSMAATSSCLLPVETLDYLPVPFGN